MPNETRLKLRSATADLHERVDAAFAAFDLGRRSDYVRVLNAHGRVLPAAERAIGQGPAWSGWRPRAALLAADLADLQQSPPLTVARVANPTDGAAWGMQYVLEGSRLGGQLLARRVAEGLPRRYLAAKAGYGGWIGFQAELETAASAAGSGWLDAAVTGAREVFVMFERAAALEVEAAL